MAISFASCKKAYTCECTTTTNSTVNGVQQPSNAKTVTTREISKTSKKNAEAICGNSTDVSTSSTIQGGNSYSYIDKNTTTCTLK